MVAAMHRADAEILRRPITGPGLLFLRKNSREIFLCVGYLAPCGARENEPNPQGSVGDALRRRRGDAKARTIAVMLVAY
jgi:hypothetical protein